MDANNKKSINLILICHPPGSEGLERKIERKEGVEKEQWESQESRENGEIWERRLETVLPNKQQKIDYIFWSW